VDINWVGRNQNSQADVASKAGANQAVGFDPKNPDYFKITFV